MPLYLDSRSHNVCLTEEHRPRSVDDRIGQEREPPRVQPAEVAACQSSSTDNTEKFQNRHDYPIETHPKRIPVEQKNDTVTLSFSMFILFQFKIIKCSIFFQTLFRDLSHTNRQYVEFCQKKSQETCSTTEPGDVHENLGRSPPIVILQSPETPQNLCHVWKNLVGFCLWPFPLVSSKCARTWDAATSLLLMSSLLTLWIVFLTVGLLR